MVKAATAKSASGAQIVTLKIALKGVKPPIGRRVLVSDAVTLGGLSDVILAAMGWVGGHLHDFSVDGRDYGDPSLLEQVSDERRLTLSGVIKQGVKRFSYTHDMGDNWEHTITIEKIGPPDPALAHPSCIAGARNCPPEDSGGIWGYAELLEILADPDHPEREERLEWLEDDEFDAEHFDIDSINLHLASARL